MRHAILLLPLLLAACMPQPGEPTGAEDFAAHCAACHGPSGMGDGELAAHLTKKPPNLTTLSTRNGGSFPMTKVMAKIWGNAKNRDSHALMPQFAPLLDSPLVPYDGGDGIMTPTPTRLVGIAEHLARLQRRP